MLDRKRGRFQTSKSGGGAIGFPATDWRFQVKQESKRGLFASTVLAGLAITMPAFAQETVKTTPAASPEASNDEDVVVVTGSRLARKDFTAISPVTTVGAQEIELTATLSVEQLLNELPQVIPGNTVTSNNAGGEDFATIDLRGIGPARTLVIVDGERVPASSLTGVVDLNTIPAGLIDRIEVVTGGASAVYGSDAIAGVVNFILKDDYEGAEVRGTIEAAQGGEGQSENIDFLMGGNFANGKGNITTYGSYFNREGVFQSAFDYSRVSAALMYDANGIPVVVDSADEFNAIRAAGGSLLLSGGSGTPPWGQIANSAANPFAGLSTNPATAARFTGVDTDCNPATAGVNVNTGTLSFNPQNQLVPYRSGNACAVPSRTGALGESSRYNFAPDNYIFIPAERWGIQTFVNYDITDKIKLKASLGYTDAESTVQLAPTPVTGLSIPVTSPAIANHPDLAAALASRTANPNANFTMAWRSVQLGPRIGINTNHSLITRASFTGELPANWEWQLSLGYGKVNFDQQLKNNVNTVALLQGLTGCANIPASARLTNCTNVDIFGPTSLTPAMANFIRTDVNTLATFEESSLSGYVRGDLFKLPAGGVAAVFGVEYRDQDGALVVDDAQRRGEIAGFNAVQSVNGSRDVYEAYTEVSVPILADQPFAHSLSVEAGYRISDYSTVGQTEAYKYGLEYAPVKWLTARAVYNKAVRAPSLLETFQNGDQGFPSFTDPCRASATSANPALRAFCITTGVPSSLAATFAANNSQVQAFAFGNPNLQSEEAETKTAGFVFQPDFLPVGDLRMSVDYYDIKLDKAIVARGAQTILNSCYANLGATPQSALDCTKIVRDTATGQINFVNTTLTNGAVPFQTKGVDVQIEYDFDLDEIFKGAPGRISIDELATFTDTYDSFGTEIKGTTEAGIGSAIPDYKLVTTLQYEIGDFLFQARHSYVPSLKQDYVGGTFEGTGAPDTPEFSNLDISGRWNVTDRLQLTAVVQNVADEFPPQTVTGFFDQANTDAALYAPWVVGRTFALSGRLKF